MISKLQQTNQASFQGFAKFKGEPNEVKHLAKRFKNQFPDSFVFSDKKSADEKTYFILTGKHQNKFIDILDKYQFSDLKRNIEEYMGKKAKKMSLDKVEKLINSKKKLSF